MAQFLPIGASDYYEFFPGLDHGAGDIWVDMPTFGMLGVEHVTAIVITPACDLQNCKVETITYLPVVSIRQAFCLRGFLPEVIRAIDAQARVIGIEGIGVPAESHVPIDPGCLDLFARRMEEIAKGRKRGEKEKAVISRLSAGVSILRKAYGSTVAAPSGSELRALFGQSTFETLTARLVTNSNRADTHFLPSDCQQPEWSAISEPSLALFRYPFSAPIEIFDRAQDISCADWTREIVKLSACIGGVITFGKRRPMKRQTLKTRFVADLLTRYVAMHVRLGAPDFTDESVRGYVSDVAGAT